MRILGIAQTFFNPKRIQKRFSFPGIITQGIRRYG
jgi:hypothetical protein